MRSAVLTELGILLLEDGRVSKSFAFSDPAGQYLAARRGDGAPNELVRHMEGLQVGFRVNDAGLLSVLRSKGIDTTPMPDDESERVQASKISMMVEAGLASDERDASARLRDFAVSLSSARVAEISGSPDLHVIQAIGALDEIDKASNTLGSRLREWYGLHFPELENLVDSIPGYARVVEQGRRDGLTRASFQDAGFPEEKAEMLEVVARNSRGGAISDGSLAMARALASQLLSMHELRRSLESHLSEGLDELAPNLSAILGRAVAARLLSRAGSLQKLASMPSSTIQVLGAEKALFRSVKSGSDPPKHGLLFQHNLIHSAPRWQRGKIARTIAAKAAIAARVDVYGEGLNETLVEEMNKRVGEISSRYSEPPNRPDRREDWQESRERRPPREGGRDYKKGRREPRDRRDEGRRERGYGREDRRDREGRRYEGRREPREDRRDAKKGRREPRERRYEGRRERGYGREDGREPGGRERDYQEREYGREGRREPRERRYDERQDREWDERRDYKDRRHEMPCDSCGTLFDMPFKPKPGRRVYCRDCFDNRKQNYGKKRRR